MPVRPRFPVQARRTGIGGHWRLWGWFVLALALTLALILGGVIFLKSGRWLVHSDPFDKVSWAVVLAGQSRDCERTDAALKLYREGRIDSVMLSACRVYKNRYESEFILKDMIDEGYPKGKLFEFHQDAYSTLEEARLLIRQFRYQNLDTVVIITANYHSARTWRTFRKLAQGFPQILVYAADFKTYDPDVWWSGRESRKYWLSEWLRTIYSWYELSTTQAENGTADFQNLLPDIWSDRSLPEPAASIPVKSDSSNASIPEARVDTTNAKPVSGDSALPSPVLVEPSPPVDTAKTSAKTEKPDKPDKPEKPTKGTGAAVTTKDSVGKVSAKPIEKRPFPRAEPASKKKSSEKNKKKS